MSKRIQLIRGVTMNWLALATSMLLGFFLSPFVVHHLGDASYGVWTVVVSIASYMGLLDLGLRGAITRTVSRAFTLENHQESSNAVSAGLLLRLGISAIVLTVSFAISRVAPLVFHVPQQLATAAQWAILITGINVSVNLTCGVFGGVLVGLHHFDAVSSITMLQTAARAVGILWLLSHGHGIVALALCELTAVALGNSAIVWRCFRKYPQLCIRLTKPDRAMLRELSVYGVWAAVFNLGQQLIYYSDNLVIAGFVSAAAVTTYAIGGNLVEYLRSVVSSMTSTFTPLASSLEASGGDAPLRRLLIQGTRAAFLVALPIEIAFLLRGSTFIRLWMGPQYAITSGHVLQILVIAQVFLNGSHSPTAILYGTSKHRINAFWVLAEAAANLTLSIILVRRIGVIGVAWGTLIPSAAVALLLRPRYVANMLELPFRTLLWQGWFRPLLAAIPYAIACYLADKLWPAQSLLMFIAQTAALLPIFAIFQGFMFWNEAGPLLRNRLSTLRPDATGASAGGVRQ